MRKDESFGVIPLSFEKGYWEVFVIQHTRSGYWGFPKGHAEPGESPEEAAFRELKEETNLEKISLLQKEPFKEEYTFILDRQKVFKTVFYFVAEVAGEIRLQTKEIHDGKWLKIEEALSRVTHKEGKTLLAELCKKLPKR